MMRRKLQSLNSGRGILPSDCSSLARATSAAKAPAGSSESAKLEGVSQPAADGLKQGDNLSHDGDQAGNGLKDVLDLGEVLESVVEVRDAVGEILLLRGHFVGKVAEAGV